MIDVNKVLAESIRVDTRSEYTKLKPIIKAAVEGYIAASKGLFPPHNPYAICGLYPGEEEDYPEAGAWFDGYWEFFKNEKKEKEHRQGNPEGSSGIHSGA